MDTSQQIDLYKKTAAEAAAAQLTDGMIVGLGSGTTAELAVVAIGARVKDGLKIIGIPTSEKTAALATSLGIQLATLEEQPAIDVTIDGADEIEAHTLNLIKGGGGNQLREKIVAVASARMIVVADERKLVQHLGKFPVAIEIIRFGWQSTAHRLQQLGARTTLRIKQGQTYITDDGNYILDCAFGTIESPATLQQQLDAVVGVVEHGLFVGIATQAVLAGAAGVELLSKDNDPA